MSYINHYSYVSPGTEMELLKKIFPTGKANELNFVLFSTSGVSGSCLTIEEDYEEWKSGVERGLGVTFLIVQPRIPRIQNGNVLATSQEDFEFLKNLRQSSFEAVLKIGM